MTVGAGAEEPQLLQLLHEGAGAAAGGGEKPCGMIIGVLVVAAADPPVAAAGALHEDEPESESAMALRTVLSLSSPQPAV